MTDKTYRIDPDIIWKEADGIIYILQPEREEIHALNETGTFIWKRIDKGRAPAQILKELLSEYNITPGHARSDLQEFINQYVREKILTTGSRGKKPKLKPKRR